MASNRAWVHVLGGEPAARGAQAGVTALIHILDTSMYKPDYNAAGNGVNWNSPQQAADFEDLHHAVYLHLIHTDNVPLQIISHRNQPV